MLNSTVDGNSGLLGAAAYVTNANLSVVSTSLTANTARESGGAVYLHQNGSLEMNTSSVADANSAPIGPFLYSFANTNSATLTSASVINHSAGSGTAAAHLSRGALTTTSSRH